MILIYFPKSSLPPITNDDPLNEGGENETDWSFLYSTEIQIIHTTSGWSDRDGVVILTDCPHNIQYTKLYNKDIIY